MTLLDVKGLSVRFSGLTALDDVSFTLEEGNVRAVIGPNGAGKSTLFNAISGYVTPTSGTVHLHGHELTQLTPHEIAERGIRRTFQNGGLFPALTVLENVLTGLHAQTHGSFLDILLGRSKALKSEAENIHRARELLKLMSMEHMADTRAGDLSGGQQRIVEIVRTVASDPPVLLLDEPAVGLSPVARAQMMEIIHRLAGEKGVGILLIEHAVELVMAAADRILVMAAGARIAEGTPEEIREDRAVLEAYLGHS
ncbi:ABC transporter ATP-binding protein [Salipiger thiooxidans]|uniref:ABC transporter ATP-binding protein n=1 Tax=Salipiger thiooxidans TaxID=282683 RepID=UPI0001B8B93C|nr:ABC transporter ATP-binding protein [Salipiger thiooxidans]EEX15202.1 ABC branched chain amino acid family transporter, ATPase subunit [Citreicella sp. SE45]MAU46894.1 ABC transporter ATP-binding protein [Salipiger sp.]MBN8185729.1 ABC transporter ATP-binding protein [Salipiger thiooxidans]NVK58900.1 ABC transporter ATP-binding protein [Paracoccaceae bacterium]